MSEAFDIVIKRGEVVHPSGAFVQDIGIKNGKIAALGDLAEQGEDTVVLDAEGLLVLPGMIDAHVHFNEPGLGYWEGFATGSSALAAGGCTAYVDMPLNGNPPTVSVEALRLKETLAVGNSAVDYAFWGGLVPGNLDRLEELHAEGVVGFKAFMSNPGGDGEGRFREVDDYTLYEGMKRIAAFGGLVALHAENDSITSMLAERMREQGRKDAAAFAESRPILAELEAVSKALLFAEKTGCRLHLVHISSADAVELIDNAKQRGVDVTLETCPHYLVMTETDMIRMGPVAKCAPPLRSEEQRERLWSLIREGKIDLIASDHSPCPGRMKFSEDLSFLDAWGGISGAQSSMELFLDEGLKRGISIERLSAMMSRVPAKRFGLYPGKGEIAIGFDADIALVDPERSYTLAADDLYYRHKHSPYVGRTFSCKVTATLSRGRLVYTSDRGVASTDGGQRLVQKIHVRA